MYYILAFNYFIIQKNTFFSSFTNYKYEIISRWRSARVTSSNDRCSIFL